MCAPKYFDIEYEINAWMHTDNQVDTEEAKQQWQKLHDIYAQNLRWNVQLVEPIEGLPDMVFTANGGLTWNGRVVLPRFRQPDRQPETDRFHTWFAHHGGFEDFYMPKYDFEGEGDALFFNDILFAGYPWRSDLPAHKEVADYLGIKVVSLQLSDARFYHLDTALTIVNHETVAIWPRAFTEEALRKIHDVVPYVIEATDEDAIGYGLNAMSDGHNIVLSDRAYHLIDKYREYNFSVHPTPISEFQKSGGGVKCLTLELR
jgi:N-dimethylarginine dimethylaminohydrolase